MICTTYFLTFFSELIPPTGIINMKNKNSMTVATQKEQESKGFFKLSWFERIAFGSGDMAQNFIYQTVTTYLLFFYTNVYGLNPAIAAPCFWESG